MACRHPWLLWGLCPKKWCIKYYDNHNFIHFITTRHHNWFPVATKCHKSLQYSYVIHSSAVDKLTYLIIRLDSIVVNKTWPEMTFMILFTSSLLDITTDFLSLQSAHKSLQYSYVIYSNESCHLQCVKLMDKVTCRMSVQYEFYYHFLSQPQLYCALSEEIAQSTAYHHLIQFCVYLHFTIMHKVIGVARPLK